jgi:histidinol-phosphate aminotransferase
MNENLAPRHDIASYWRPHDDDAVFLHLGENPFAPTERVKTALMEAIQNVNRYPDTNCMELREKIADYVGHDAAAENIIVGNGSDELIDLSVVAFGNQTDPAVVFSPSFFVYGFAAKRHGVPVVLIARDDDFDLPAVDDIPAQLKDGSYSVSFIANPNNPTGTLTARERLIEYIEQWPGIIVVDECYFEYAGETVVDLIHQNDNLLVLRSLSKSFGMSGLRLGYAVASRSVIDRMERYAMTFPVNVCAQAAGIAALEDADIYRQRIKELQNRKDALQAQLEGFGLDVPPSQANFLLTLWPESWNDKKPAQLFADKGILLSDQSANMNLGRPALRIGVGSEAENQRFLKAAGEILGIA